MGFWTYEDEMRNRSLLSFEEGEAAGIAKGEARGIAKGESQGRDAERKRIGDFLMQMKSEGKSLDEVLAQYDALYM